MYVPPYNPKFYPKASRYLSSGRLRRLNEVMLTNRRLSLVVKTTSRRPRNRADWRPYYRIHLYRSGYQERQMAALFALVLDNLRSKRASVGRKSAAYSAEGGQAS